MSVKIAVLDQIDPSEKQIARLEALAGSSDALRLFYDQPNPGNDWDLVVDRIGDSTIVITSWTDFPAHVIQRLPNVELISVVATGYSWIDTGQASKQRMLVTNVPGYAAVAVAELAFGLILSLRRNIHLYSARIRTGDFSRLDHPGSELCSQTIGVVGTGAIGSQVIRIAKGFGMRVLAFTKHPSSKRASSLGVQYVELDDLLEQADVVSCHAALTDETAGLFSDAEFGKMKRDALFVCTSRPEVYDEKALLMHLRSGKLGGAALDETRKESQTPSNPLLALPNVVITPEIGFHTEQALARLVDISIDNVEAFLKGHPVNVVNPEAL